VNKTTFQALGCAWLAAIGSALADTPAFDRPGIAFSTTTIPRGSFALELGVPDFIHASDSGSRSTTYRLDTNARAGLGSVVELQLATPLLNYRHSDTAGVADSTSGLGDSRLSLKAALPSSNADFSWAMLAGVTFASGASAFSGGGTQYTLATSMNQKLDDTWTAGFYIELDGADGATDYTLSPDLNFTLGSTLNGYVEAAYTHVPHSPDSSVAGAGLAWMVTPIAQLDLSFDLGLTNASPKLQGGIGFSIYLR
jgi:hypothetical protein